MNEVCDICTYQIVSLSLVIREGYIIHEYLCRFVIFFMFVCVLLCVLCVNVVFIGNNK